MGELNRDVIERQAGGLMAALSMLSGYPAGQNLPAARFNEIRIILEQCAGTDNACRQCAHKAPCRAAFDELSGRVK
jgi:hypothetical protein